MIGETMTHDVREHFVRPHEADYALSVPASAGSGSMRFGPGDPLLACSG
jgi:hypothetical protein